MSAICKSAVTKVRIYQDRASITRSTQVSASDFSGSVIFGPLPAKLDSATVRATAALLLEGGLSQEVTVRAISSRVLEEVTEPSPRRDLRIQLEELENQLLPLEGQEENYRQQLRLIHHFSELCIEKFSQLWSEAEGASEQWTSTLDQLFAQVQQLTTCEYQRKTQLNQLKREISHLQQRLKKLEENRETAQLIEVELVVPEGTHGVLQVDLAYVSFQARWSPAYDIRHLARTQHQDEQVELIAAALIEQNTGEDWTQVELTATTARPPVSEPPPELSKIVVSGFQGTEQKQVVSTSTQRLNSPHLLRRAKPRHIMVEHRAPKAIDIPSGEQKVRVELFRNLLPSVSSLEIPPTSPPMALEVVELTNTTQKLLLPGTVNIFRGPNYGGQCELPFISSGERFRIPLGINQQLRIRRRTYAHPEKRGPITGSVNYDFEVRLDIENTGDQSIHVIAKDRIPVSRTEETAVKILNMEPSMEVSQENGLSKLRLSIAPKSKRTVNTVFRVTAPRGFVVERPEVL